MMNEFMIPNRAEPWNPLRANAGPIRGDLGSQHGAAPFGQVFPNFMSFRGDAPPSEADTVSRSVAFLSDSGYESMARQSLGNRSVYGGDVDQSAETESLISRFHRGLPQGSMSADESRKREARNQKASTSPNSNTQICPTCKATVKTNSEMKLVIRPLSLGCAADASWSGNTKQGTADPGNATSRAAPRRPRDLAPTTTSSDISGVSTSNARPTRSYIAATWASARTSPRTGQGRTISSSI